MTTYPPINARCPHLLHGGDYNPDQWLDRLDIPREDLRLMDLAGCNAMSVGIFAWSALEPREGHFTFDWLDRLMDDFAARGIFAVLATPSGARPAWMAQRYPEVRRVDANRQRQLFGARHNHCYTSPVYREKVEIINTKLAERYGGHQALLIWHLSNEYGGACYCPLCEDAFRQWLRRKYEDNLDALNAAWYTAFWSHGYADWSQIEAPAPHGMRSHGVTLDWMRFVTAQTADFIRHETLPLKRLAPDIPVTTNFMGLYDGLDYWRLAPLLDVISWDSYPSWHHGDDLALAASVAFVHNLNRSLKGGRPFMLMESTPSMTNWQPFSKLKRPGMHLLSSLQAVAHGSDTVQYFQWRKSRGDSEKFHGAVVDHAGHERTRVFREVAAVGEMLAKMDAMVGTIVPAEVAVIFDWENRWAMTEARGPRNDSHLDYEGTCQRHMRPFWARGIAYDVLNMECDFSAYKLLIAPMLYMVRPGVAERMEAFVRAGGTLVATYMSGWVDEYDLCFLGGFPGPLREVLGLWAEEIDALAPEDVNAVVPREGNALGLSGEYQARIFCERVHPEGAETLAVYARDFYAGEPAATVNALGDGRAYYLATRTDDRFLDDFYGALAGRLALRRALDTELPHGVTAHHRTDGERDYLFLMNFSAHPQRLALPDSRYTDLLTGEEVGGELPLAAYGIRVLAAGAGR